MWMLGIKGRLRPSCLSSKYIHQLSHLPSLFIGSFLKNKRFSFLLTFLFISFTFYGDMDACSVKSEKDWSWGPASYPVQFLVAVDGQWRQVDTGMRGSSAAL